MLDGISDSHWPQSNVLDKAVAEEIQAAEAVQHSVLRALLLPRMLLGRVRTHSFVSQ
jgi:hypothetical protein